VKEDVKGEDNRKSKTQGFSSTRNQGTEERRPPGEEAAERDRMAVKWRSDGGF